MKHIVMIGSPLIHARSPGIINPMLRDSHEDVEVTTRELREDELQGFVAAARSTDDVVGLIVTTPLKRAICAYLDRTTAIVDLIGASNCVRCDGDMWFGANFDGYGFAAAIGSALKTISGRTLLVGCGGAGSAIAASLVTLADIGLFLFDLDFAKAADLAARLEKFAPKSRISAIRSLDVGAEVVINASTSGMAKGDMSPIPEDIVSRTSVVADIVNDRDTALKQDARRYGKMLIEGEAMVRGQAAYLQRFILGTTESERDVVAGRP
jgi:shikimate dehydrogenase